MQENNIVLKPNLAHLYRLTRPDGLLQHSLNHIPDPNFGYSIDDNARALIICSKHYQIFKDNRILELASIYLTYIKRAQTDEGYFRNFMNIDGQYPEEKGSPDSFARTFWAISFFLSQKPENRYLKNLAQQVWKNIVYPEKSLLNFIKSTAFYLCGWCELGVRSEVALLADILVAKYEANRRRNWRWFEEKLTYSNAILPYSLFKAYLATKNNKYLETAEESFLFLDRVCRIKNVPVAIGQNGWFRLGGKKNIFDQQSIDVCDMVLAAVAGFEATKDSRYIQKAYFWFEWFWGNNINNEVMIDEKTFGCYDGLKISGINSNQGAESIIAYLLSYLELLSFERRNK